jgi:hypothetical protein
MNPFSQNPFFQQFIMDQRLSVEKSFRRWPMPFISDILGPGPVNWQCIARFILMIQVVCCMHVWR